MFSLIFVLNVQKVESMKSEYQNSIISKIRNLRIDNKFSQKDMAEFMEISTGQMLKYLYKNYYVPPLDMILCQTKLL